MAEAQRARLREKQCEARLELLSEVGPCRALKTTMRFSLFLKRENSWKDLPLEKVTPAAWRKTQWKWPG